MRARTIVASGVAVALAAAGLTWATASRPRVPTYTVATAVRGDVTQALQASGTVTRPGQSALTFDTPGTVTALAVKVGDPVTKGQPLASIDPAPLRVTLLQAQAQLAQARAVLDADKAAKDAGGTAVALPGSSAGTGGTAPASGGSTSSPKPTAPPTTPAYLTTLSASLAKLQAVASAQQAACAPVYALVDQLKALQASLPTTLPTALPSGLPTGIPTALPSPLPTSLPTSPPTPTTPAPSAPSATASPSPSNSAPTPALSVEEAKKLAASVQACAAAMTALAGAEQDAGQAIAAASQGFQRDTVAAQQQLAAAQAQLAAAAQAAAQQAAQQAIAQAQAQLAAQAQRLAGSRVTDATLAADRARIVQAEQAVGRAQRSVDAATLTSPVDGTVGAVSLAAGESSAGRSVVVAGPGVARVAVEVPLALRPLVESGQSATVGLVGTDPSLKGVVTSVSVLPTSASGSPTYTAVVELDDPGMLLFGGAKALVQIPLRTASGVVTVPVSAVVKLNDTTANVQVVPDAFATSATTVQVTTGTIGGGRVEVVNGLDAGQVVVLADRRLPVPGGLAQYQPASPSASPSATPGR